MPSGYDRIVDGDEEYFQNIFTGVKWYTAKDESTGNVYYYEMNGNEGSRWSLPNVSRTFQDHLPAASDEDVKEPTSDNEDKEEDVFEDTPGSPLKAVAAADLDTAFRLRVKTSPVPSPKGAAKLDTAPSTAPAGSAASKFKRYVLSTLLVVVP